MKLLVDCREIGEVKEHYHYGEDGGWYFVLQSGVFIMIPGKEVKSVAMVKDISILTEYISKKWEAEKSEDVQEIPRIAVKVSGGLVRAVYANAAVDVDVYDLDVSDFPDEEDYIEQETAAEQIEKIAADPAFHLAW